MINLIEINKAINNTIYTALSNTDFKDIKIIAEDITEPIIRPSIKVGLDNFLNGKYNANCREKKLTVRVYFFSRDKYNYKIDNMKMQDILENAFLEPLKIKDNFLIEIEEVESEISDTVLICSFDLYMIEDLINTNSGDNDEIMEDLNLEI